MFAPQREWWTLPNYIKALVAGYGGGKTYIGAKRSIAVALQNAPVPHLAVSPSYKMARRTTIPAIGALLDGKRTILPGLRWRYHKTEHEFTIWYRGREAKIWIASGDDPDSLRGPTVGSGWIDEPFIQDEEVLNQTMARIRSNRAKVRELFLTGTPEQLNWGYDICEGERAADFDLGLVQYDTRVNTALPNEYAKNLIDALSEKAAQAYVEGKFVNLQTGTIYYEFDFRRNMVELPDPGTELEVGMDFNVDPMAAAVFWRNGPHVHVIKEIELPNADTEFMCGYLQDTFKYPRGHAQEGKCRIHTVYPDATGSARKTAAAAGRSDFHIIREAGFELLARPSNPKRRDRYNAVNGKLKEREGKGATLTFDPSCKRLRAYMTKLTHEEFNKQKGMTHLTDALGYPIAYLFPIRSEFTPARLSGA